MSTRTRWSPALSRSTFGQTAPRAALMTAGRLSTEGASTWACPGASSPRPLISPSLNLRSNQATFQPWLAILVRIPTAVYLILYKCWRYSDFASRTLTKYTVVEIVLHFVYQCVEIFCSEMINLIKTKEKFCVSHCGINFNLNTNAHNFISMELARLWS